MALAATIRKGWRSWWHTAAMVALFAAIVAWLLFGSTGLFAWNDYRRALDQRRAELALVQDQRAMLENDLRLLNPRHVDPDLAEERIRRDLNLLHPDDIVVPLPKR